MQPRLDDNAKIAICCRPKLQFYVRKRTILIDVEVKATLVEDHRRDSPLLRHELLQLCPGPAIHCTPAFNETLPTVRLVIRY